MTLFIWWHNVEYFCCTVRVIFLISGAVWDIFIQGYCEGHFLYRDTEWGLSLIRDIVWGIFLISGMVWGMFFFRLQCELVFRGIICNWFFYCILFSYVCFNSKEQRIFVVNSAKMNCGQEKSSWRSGQDGKELKENNSIQRIHHMWITWCHCLSTLYINGQEKLFCNSFLLKILHCLAPAAFMYYSTTLIWSEYSLNEHWEEDKRGWRRSHQRSLLLLTLNYIKQLAL